MRKTAITAFFLMLTVVAFAKDESIESLKARAAEAEGSKRVELFTKIAQRQLDELSRAYDQEQTKKAELALQDVEEYALKAVDTSQTTGKRMKQTEIAVRQISERLEDIQRGLSTEERTPVGTAIKKLDSARSALLRFMFRKR